MLAEVWGQRRSHFFTLFFSSLLMLSLQLISYGQTNTRKSIRRNEIYGGIEIGTKSIKAVAIQRFEPEGRIRMVFNEVINKSFAKTIEGKLTPEAIITISQTVDSYYKRMLKQYLIPAGQIYIIGCSDLKALDTGDLAKMITYKTGQKVTLLDLQTEASLDIAGTIPRRYLDNSTWFDNRGMSVLIDVGNCDTKGGYQQIRMLPAGNPDYIFDTFGIPQGTITFTDEIAAMAGEGSDLRKFAGHARMLSEKSILEALKIEMGKRPGLVNRKKVYLSGDIVWAMVTLLFPEDRQPQLTLRVDDINEFYNRAVSDPQGLLRPSLPNIRDKRARLEAEKQVEDVRNTFTPENLVAGAEILRMVASAFNLSGKDREIIFTRFSNLSLLTSYLRLQADTGTPQP